MIKYLIMDVDGTLTDGKIIMGENGELGKNFDVKDGYGIHEILPEHRVIPVIFTGRRSAIVENRCKELGICEVYQNIRNKAVQLKIFLSEKGVSEKDIAYIGDDLNDLEVMQAVKDGGGLIGCPNDAVCEVKEIADFISAKDGGCGAVREFICYLIKDVTKIYIAGAHSRGRTLRTYLEYLYSNVEVEAFLVDDMSENEAVIDGVPVLLIGNDLHTDYPVYLGTRGVNHPKLTDELKAAGMKEIIPVTVELDMRLRNEFVRRYMQNEGREFQLIDDLQVSE